MTVAAGAVRRAGQARTARAARRAVAEASRAAQVQAWQDRRAEAIRVREQARAARITAREDAIRDHTVDYLLAVEAEREVMEAARRRCEVFRAQVGAAVAGLREQGLTRTDLAQLTGLSAREIAAVLAAGDVTVHEPATDARPADPANGAASHAALTTCADIASDGTGADAGPGQVPCAQVAPPSRPVRGAATYTVDPAGTDGVGQPREACHDAVDQGRECGPSRAAADGQPEGDRWRAGS